jgi:hypothetical protein
MDRSAEGMADPPSPQRLLWAGRQAKRRAGRTELIFLCSLGFPPVGLLASSLPDDARRVEPEFGILIGIFAAKELKEHDAESLILIFAIFVIFCGNLFLVAVLSGFLQLEDHAHQRGMPSVVIL